MTAYCTRFIITTFISNQKSPLIKTDQSIDRLHILSARHITRRHCIYQGKHTFYLFLPGQNSLLIRLGFQMEIYIVGTLIHVPNLKSTRPIYYKHCCTRINCKGQSLKSFNFLCSKIQHKYEHLALWNNLSHIYRERIILNEYYSNSFKIDNKTTFKDPLKSKGCY